MGFSVDTESAPLNELLKGELQEFFLEWSPSAIFFAWATEVGVAH